MVEQPVRRVEGTLVVREVPETDGECAASLFSGTFPTAVKRPPGGA